MERSVWLDIAAAGRGDAQVTMESEEIIRLAHRYMSCQDLAGLGTSADDHIASTYSAVDDLIDSDEQDSIRLFLVECCREKTDEQLGFVGAGVVEDVVHRGNLIALRALVDAARFDRKVRRSLGYAWLTVRSEGGEWGQLVAEVESLAIHGQIET